IQLSGDARGRWLIGPRGSICPLEERMRSKACVLLPFLVAVPVPASADTLYPGANSGGVITSLSAGVKEIGVESTLVVGYDKAAGASDLRATLFAGPTFRYFLANNLSLSFNASFLYKESSADAPSGATAPPGQLDLGGLGTVTIAYYASLGG